MNSIPGLNVKVCRDLKNPPLKRIYKQSAQSQQSAVLLPGWFLLVSKIDGVADAFDVWCIVHVTSCMRSLPSQHDWSRLTLEEESQLALMREDTAMIRSIIDHSMLTWLIDSSKVVRSFRLVVPPGHRGLLSSSVTCHDHLQIDSVKEQIANLTFCDGARVQTSQAFRMGLGIIRVQHAIGQRVSNVMPNVLCSPGSYACAWGGASLCGGPY